MDRLKLHRVVKSTVNGKEFILLFKVLFWHMTAIQAAANNSNFEWFKIKSRFTVRKSSTLDKVAPYNIKDIKRTK